MRASPHIEVTMALAIIVASCPAQVSSRLLDEGPGHEPVAQEPRDGAEPERRVDALPRVAERVARRARRGVVVDDWAPAFASGGMSVSEWITGYLEREDACMLIGIRKDELIDELVDWVQLTASLCAKLR